MVFIYNVMLKPYHKQPKPPYPSDRPLSWSQLSQFSYSPYQWYQNYVLGNKEPPNKEMLFGKLVGESFGTTSPLAPVIVYERMEHELKGEMDGLKLIGYIDSWCPKEKKLREYKTSKNKRLWTQNKVDNHGQLTMYVLMLYLFENIHPDDITIHLDYIPVHVNKNNEMEITKPSEIKTFETKRTMEEIMFFKDYIIKQRQKMIDFYEKQ